MLQMIPCQAQLPLLLLGILFEEDKFILGIPWVFRCEARSVILTTKNPEKAFIGDFC